MSNEKSWSIVTSEFHELLALALLYLLDRLMIARLQKFFRDKSSIGRSFVLFILLFPPLLTVATALTLAIWVIPNIDHYHQFIEVEAARAIEAPVKIKKIKADWSGINPRLRFENIRIFDQQGRPVLTFDQVENVLSWRTLFVGELRLKSLLIEQPSLSIRRDAQGVLSIAGIKIDEQKIAVVLIGCCDKAK